MMQFARRSRWFLPLTLLVTVVAVQLVVRADGSERQDRMSATTQVEEPDYEEFEEELEQPLQELVEAQLSEPTTGRSRKRLWRVDYRRKAALVPLILVAVTATFIAAGFIAKRYHLLSGQPKKKVKPVAGKEAAQKVSAPPSVQETAEDLETSESRLTSLLKLGQRVLSPAVALAIATGALSMMFKQSGEIPAGTPTNSTSSP